MRAWARRGASGAGVMAAAGLALVLVACGGPSEEGGAAGASTVADGSQGQEYDLHGIVTAVEPEEKRLIVDHETIPGFMMAMTMPYDVKDDEGLAKVAAGDEITAKVVKEGNHYWLEKLAVVASGAAATP